MRDVTQECMMETQECMMESATRLGKERNVGSRQSRAVDKPDGYCGFFVH